MSSAKLINPYNAAIFVYKPWRPKVFYFEIIIDVLVLSAPFEYLCYGLTVIIVFAHAPSAGTVFRRQILTSKDDPRAERVNRTLT